MKLFKKISALLAAVAIFGSTALAADLKFDDKMEYAADATKVTVNVYSNIDNIGAYSETLVTYDPEVYTYNAGESSSTASSYELADNGDAISWSTLAVYNIADVTKPYITLVFDVNPGMSPVGTTFTIAPESWTYNGAEDYDFDVADISVTVTAAGPVGPNPGDIKTPATTISGNKKYSEVYDSNLNARVVFEENIGAQTVTADSVLKAKYLNDTHVANIFELLGITGDGEVEFTSFTVKMVLPAGTAVTDDFSFVIQ